jgi:hypothetical protein
MYIRTTRIRIGMTELRDPSTNTNRMTIKHTWINKEKSVKPSYPQSAKVRIHRIINSDLYPPRQDVVTTKYTTDVTNLHPHIQP